MEFMALQKGTFSLLKTSGIPDFHGWYGRRRTLIQGWISSKGADVAQEPLEKTQQSCLLVGEGGKKFLLTTRCSYLQRKVMIAGMRKGEKNAGQHPVWEKVAPLPTTAKSCSEPPYKSLPTTNLHCGKGSQPTHLCVWAISIYLHPGLAPGKKISRSFLGGAGSGCRKSREGNGCICQLQLLLGHGWTSPGTTWVGYYCSSLVELSYYLYRASIPPALNGFLVFSIPSSSAFLAHSPKFQWRKEKNNGGDINEPKSLLFIKFYLFSNKSMPYLLF